MRCTIDTGRRYSERAPCCLVERCSIKPRFLRDHADVLVSGLKNPRSIL